jgi:hypothetical protein
MTAKRRLLPIPAKVFLAAAVVTAIGSLFDTVLNNENKR